jgi:hypothetical protein
MAGPWKEMGRYGSVGIELVLTILIVSWIGHWLDDRYWGGHGWGLVGGFVLGATMGFRNLIRTAGQMQRDIERAESRDPQAGRWNVDPGWLHELHEERPGAPSADEAERGASPPDEAGTRESTDDDGAPSRDRSGR